MPPRRIRPKTPSKPAIHPPEGDGEEEKEGEEEPHPPPGHSAHSAHTAKKHHPPSKHAITSTRSTFEVGEEDQEHHPPSSRPAARKSGLRKGAPSKTTITPTPSTLESGGERPKRKSRQKKVSGISIASGLTTTHSSEDIEHEHTHLHGHVNETDPSIPPTATPSVANNTPPSNDPTTRRILINKPQLEKYKSNFVRTSKYSILTFLPLFLYEQFRRLSNVFFLLTALCQQIPDVSPTGKFTTAMPLAVIISVSGVKEALEDKKRHKADKKTNNADALVLKSNTFQTTKWEDVAVGDFLKLENNSFVPADIVLFSSSEPMGMAYIETANLDGETNLKLRQALPITSKIGEEEFSNLQGSIECGVPNRHIYEFTGSLQLNSEEELNPLGPDQLLLRGSKLRNTKWVIGLVVYTGHETKLMKNSSKAPLKQSTLDKATNYQILALFITLVAMALISTVMWSIEEKKRAFWYLRPMNTPVEEKSIFDDFTIFKQFLTFMLLFNNLIPISLSVTLECVRFMQAKFINWDNDMYHEESDMAAQARTSNLNEELGQIRYIFSDKTGTLTRNVMEFKGCTVGGVLYPYESLFPEGTPIRGSHIASDVKKAMVLNREVAKGNTVVQDFLTAMAVCHNVIPEKIEEEGVMEIIYNAASPDEKALVEGATRLGYEFVDRSPTQVEISVIGERRIYEVLNLIEFTSQRKRMTAILRCPDKKIRLYCKGADSIILERCIGKDAKAQSHLDYFAAEGLRTLCFAVKLLTEEEYKKWNKEFQLASTAINQREEKIAEKAEMIEKDLHLIGATAIEDKLQDFVPETIASFLEAGVAVWVLTGDKQETAINIGNSCRLITPSMGVYIINQETMEATLDCIKAFQKELNINIEDIKKKGKHAFDKSEDLRKVAIVIDGKTLLFALQDNLKFDFLSLCCSCVAVIVCRAAPMQKAEVVQHVVKMTGAITLSIGDGANDVAMIQKAHVGIGISGNEGLQAACASDYAIAQFYYLKKLLLVHGAWNHDRITKAIFYSYYKNITLYIIELWYAIYSAWSGQIVFDRWVLTCYNLVFVCMQPLAIGIFEQNCSMALRMRFPVLYLATSNGAFNLGKFFLWLANAVLHSAMIYWMTMEAFANGTIWSNGKEGNYLVMGSSIYTYVVVAVSLKVGLETRSWTMYTHVSIWGSIVLWFLFFIGISYIWPVGNVLGNEMFDVAGETMTSLVFWLCLIVVPVATLIPDLLYKTVGRTLYPTLQDEYCEMEGRLSVSEEGKDVPDAEEVKPPPPHPPPPHHDVSGAPTPTESSSQSVQEEPNDETTEGEGPKKKVLRRKKKPPVRRPSQKRLSSKSITHLTPTEQEALLFSAQLERAQAGPKVFVFCPEKKTLEEKKLAAMRHAVDDVESTSYGDFGGVAEALSSKSQVDGPRWSVFSRIWNRRTRREEEDVQVSCDTAEKTTSTVDLEGNEKTEEDGDSSSEEEVESNGSVDSQEEGELQAVA